MRTTKITLLAIFTVALTAGVASAQTHAPSPAWMVSKPVNRIANKQLFENHRLQASHIRAESIARPNKVSAKAVHRIPRASAEGNVVSTGYPVWTISKGVHR